MRAEARRGRGEPSPYANKGEIRQIMRSRVNSPALFFSFAEVALDGDNVFDFFEFCENTTHLFEGVDL